MKKLIVIGLIVLSATSLAEFGGRSAEGQIGSSMEKHQTKEIEKHYVKDNKKEVSKHHEKKETPKHYKEKEVSKHHEEKERLQNKANTTFEDGEELQTKTQQRIILEEKDVEDILNPKNAKSKKFRERMERKYDAKWKIIEGAAKEWR